MHNPLAHIDIDTAPIESALGTAFEVVTDTFSDVTDTLGDRLSSDVIPLAKSGAERARAGAKVGAEHTQSFVRTRTRVSLAAVAGVALLVGLVVFVKRSRRDDSADHVATGERQGPRSVA